MDEANAPRVFVLVRVLPAKLANCESAVWLNKERATLKPQPMSFAAPR